MPLAPLLLCLVPFYYSKFWPCKLWNSLGLLARAAKKPAHSAYGELNERTYLKEAEVGIIWLGLLPDKQPLVPVQG